MRIHQISIRTRSRRRGAAVVEFAVCVPVLISLLFGLLEFSRMTQLQQTARLAAFEGARAGINLDATTSDVRAAVTSMMNAVDVTTFTTTISPTTLAYTTPTVSVTVSVPAKANAWISMFVTSATTITATITLDREVQAVSVP